jgi:hypothetical protein
MKRLPLIAFLCMIAVIGTILVKEGWPDHPKKGEVWIVTKPFHDTVTIDSINRFNSVIFHWYDTVGRHIGLCGMELFEGRKWKDEIDTGSLGIITRAGKGHFWHIDSAGRRYNMDRPGTGVRVYDTNLKVDTSNKHEFAGGGGITQLTGDATGSFGFTPIRDTFRLIDIW